MEPIPIVNPAARLDYSRRPAEMIDAGFAEITTPYGTHFRNRTRPMPRKLAPSIDQSAALGQNFGGFGSTAATSTGSEAQSLLVC